MLHSKHGPAPRMPAEPARTTKCPGRRGRTFLSLLFASPQQPILITNQLQSALNADAASTDSYQIDLMKYMPQIKAHRWCPRRPVAATLRDRAATLL